MLFTCFGLLVRKGTMKNIIVVTSIFKIICWVCAILFGVCMCYTLMGCFHSKMVDKSFSMMITTIFVRKWPLGRFYLEKGIRPFPDASAKFLGLFLAIFWVVFKKYVI